MNTHDKRKRFAALLAGRMRAAVTTARGSGIKIFGRTAAIAITDNDDAVRRVCLRGHQGFAAGVQALCDAAQAAFAGIAPGNPQNVGPEPLMARLTRAAEHDRRSEEFLRPSVGGSA
jgi:hypothetical protein